jgi:flagellar biosynthesis regulator FlaF
MISKEDRPDSGSDIERKLIESLCKNQYTKYKKAETSMKSIERLLQSRSIMDTIEATETVLNKFDMKDPFTIVYPEDKTLARVALKMKANGSGIRSLEILSDFRQVTIDEVALSCSWWNLHGHYKDKDNTKQSYGRDMNWSYLHFKNHVDEVLYNDTDKLFNTYDKKQRGGPLFFKLLTNAVLSANEDSLSALESTIKNYKIAEDGKDDVPEAIKILQAGSKLITAMRDDGSNKPNLPDKFVVNVISVLCTTSVEVFNKKMEAYQGSLELALLVDSSKKINTPIILEKVFTVARNYHKELFDDGIWETQVQSKAKSSFASFWRNRCWNCEQENCNLSKCNQTKDLEKIDRNKNKWLSEVQGSDRSQGDKQTSKGGRAKKHYPEWRAPEPSENNKRLIYGKPYTWDGRKSWIKDETPASGLPEVPLSANAAVPGQVADHSDEATAMTSESGFTQEDKNELRRFEASIKNMGANLSGMGAFISNLSEK